ncbi:MAG TPA: hypothetical protein VFR08_06055, partial [Candidatus Angelobacter sp.]|nr:hypothetical protein [Candidatus Angelobacter sp.]
MLKKIIATLALMSVVVAQAAAQTSGAPASQALPAKTVKVLKHTGLKFATVSPIDSATTRVGDDVPLRLTSSLIINGATVMNEGDLVHARVVKVRKAKPGCRDGEVDLKADEITFVDTSKAKAKIWLVTANPKAEVPSRIKEDFVWESNMLLPADNWYELALALPADALMVAILSPVLALFGLVYVFGAFSKCFQPGNEYQLPAG